ncbi:hypothetical protein L7F22_006323 [Adiantum nelumboides]|nr:hypothetical protein [Adiantum nelumboides]
MQFPFSDAAAANMASSFTIKLVAAIVLAAVVLDGLPNASAIRGISKVQAGGAAGRALLSSKLQEMEELSLEEQQQVMDD